MKKLKDLYYGIYIWDEDNQDRKLINVFSIIPVRDSVALYKVGRLNKVFNPTSGNTLEQWTRWCFESLHWRAQWEVGFGAPFLRNGKWSGHKTDVYTLYIEPNAALLKQMVDEVSVNSCKQWIKEHKRR